MPSASPILCAKKNAGVQHKFKPSCIKNNVKPIVLFFGVFLKVNSINEMKMVVYKNAHAGWKTHAGGVNGGWLRV